jgi:hypothetical protein
MDYADRAKRFRNLAEECRQLAGLAHSDSAKQTYLNVARSYDIMGDDMEDLLATRGPNHRQAS